MAPDMRADPDLQAAYADALKESEFATQEDADAKSWDDWENEGGTAAPVANAEEEPGKDESSETLEPAEADAQLDIPEFFKGLGLEGLPPEQAKLVLDTLQQQETYISKLQGQLAKEPAPSDDTPPPAEPEEVTDEALAIALGYDPNDQYNQPSASELKLARTVLALEEKLDSVVEAEQTREVSNQWNSNLDQLEADYGKLPFDRLQVLRFAVEEGIASPFEAYFRIKAPIQKEVDGAIAAARTKEVAKRAEAGGVKPRSSSGTSTPIKPGTSLRDAVGQAMRETEKETGLSWRNVFKKVRFDEES